MFEQVWIAVVGGLVVLAVQGLVLLARERRRRILAGEGQVGPAHESIRRLSQMGRKRWVRARLSEAADLQRARIEEQYAQDPLWVLGQIRLVQARLDNSSHGERVGLEDLLAAGGSSSRGIFVRGESGSGKSSIAALTAANYWRRQRQLGLRFDLSEFQPRRPLLAQLAGDLVRIRHLEAGFILREVVLIFDGFEALTNDDDRAAFDAMLEALTRRFPSVRYAILSRPEATPTRLLVKAVTYDIVPLVPADVDSAVRRFEPSLLLEMDQQLRSLCSSPLALRMFIRTYGQRTGLPRGIAGLYADFVEALLSDDDRLGPGASSSSSAKLEILADLAYRVDNGAVTFETGTILRHISEKLTELASRYLVPSSIDSSSMLRSLVSHGVLRSDGKTVKFVHQSVQEYLAAIGLLLRLDGSQNGLEKVWNLAPRPEWRTSIIFLAGLLADATEMVDGLRSRNRLLAAECIRSAASISPFLVDKCIVEALYEFKFGTTSFNYELIFALALIAERRSPDLPERIISEMEYWCRKYATRPLRDLTGVENEVLVVLLEGNELTPQVSDAIWTLGSRGYAAARPQMERFLRDRRAPLDHVSALALGRLRDRSSAQLLLSTALDETAPDPLRSACFNSIGMIGAKECLPAIVDLIRSETETEGTIRENAAWALIGLADDLLLRATEFQELIIAQLGVGRPYARAMFAYLLGRFRISRGLPVLIKLASDTMTDALLLEDVVFAIGEFGSLEAVPTLVELLRHQDNVVRARVVEALAKCSVEQALIASYADTSESSEIVRDAARAALGGDGPASVHMPSPDIRRRR